MAWRMFVNVGRARERRSPPEARNHVSDIHVVFVTLLGVGEKVMGTYLDLSNSHSFL